MASQDRWLYAWALGYVAVGAASLLIPLYALALGGDAFVAAVVEASVALAGVPGALLWGRLADRTGRRRVFVLISLAGTAAGYLAAFAVAGALVAGGSLLVLTSRPGQPVPASTGVAEPSGAGPDED